MGLRMAEVIKFPKGGLRQLDLSQNPIGDAACVAFAKSLVSALSPWTTYCSSPSAPFNQPDKTEVDILLSVRTHTCR